MEDKLFYLIIFLFISIFATGIFLGVLLSDYNLDITMDNNTKEAFQSLNSSIGNLKVNTTHITNNYFCNEHEVTNDR